jgi:hypothetical protein
MRLVTKMPFSVKNKVCLLRGLGAAVRPVRTAMADFGMILNIQVRSRYPSLDRF